MTEIGPCVILAGGLGTRMRPATETLPKALIPVVGKPFIHHQLTWLESKGVRDIVLSIGYRAEAIRAFVGDGSRWGLEVTYVDEGPELRGTAGALSLAIETGVLDSSFGVLYGDSYLPVELEPIWKAFIASGHAGLMTVFCNEDRWETSNACYADGMVVLYDKAHRGPQATQMRYVDYGLSFLQPDVISSRVLSGSVADLADIYHDLSKEGQLAGYEVAQPFYEIGSPGGLVDLEVYLSGHAVRGAFRVH